MSHTDTLLSQILAELKTISNQLSGLAIEQATCTTQCANQCAVTSQVLAKSTALLESIAKIYRI